MATGTIERIQLSIGGLLSVGRESSQQLAGYQRVLTRVTLTTKGTNPATSNIGIQVKIADVAQSTEYLLPAGLKLADNNADLVVPANAAVSFIVSTAPIDMVAVDMDVWLEFAVGVQAEWYDTTDCGLGTLGEVKRFLINSGYTGSENFNEAIIHLARWTARLFDDMAGKNFKRAVGATEQCTFSRRNLVLAHTPLETVSKMELKYNEAQGWIDLTTGFGYCLLDSVQGIVVVPDDFWPISNQFQHGKPGLWRLTVTGGYWYDPSDNGSGTLPAGATELPEDLKTAWLLQIQHLWVNRDNLGITWSPAGEVHDTRKSLAGVKLLPLVSQTLTNYSRSVNLR